ncbi:MAG TPA: protein kinase [Polyangiaceae bacterium]|nr:protein kinase [Polyangiaceae bacterium]
MQPSDPYGLAGQVLDGQFRVDRPVGEGGFSVVYRGKHLGLGEPIAIKCLKLPPRLGSAIVENFVRRFRDESKIQYKLSQASLHVARTIAAGTAMAPSVNALVPFMVLEWLEGYPLAEELRARRGRGESGRPLAEVLRLLDPVAEALAMAHGMGVVHRDLNPSNIFLALDAAGNLRPKVMDFGVAKVVSDHALALGPRTATLNQLRLFTPPYGAPEQFDDRVGPVGTWTDVYSFALVVVELLTDRTPNDGDDLLALMARACDPANRPTPQARGAAVGAAVEEVFVRALSVDPTRRPVDVGEFWGHLKHVAGPAATRPSGSHTAKGTFILADPPPAVSAPPTTPPAFALPLSKPAHGNAATSAPPMTASWHNPPVLPPMNDADTWHSPPLEPNGSAAPKRTPAPTWGGGPATVNDRAPTAEFVPEHSISPLAETGPTPEPTSHVDPFGPTAQGAEGVEARPGASPLSMTVKPGEKRPDFFGHPSSPPRAPAHTPNSGLPPTVPARKKAPTPGVGVQPLRTPAPTPGGGVSGAPTPGGGVSGAPVPQAAGPYGTPPGPQAPGPYGTPPGPQAPGPYGTPPGPQASVPYGPPPGPQSPGPYGPAPSGHTPYPPLQSGPGGAPYATPPAQYPPRSAPPETPPSNVGYGLPPGQAPLRPLEEGMVPLPPTPSALPPEPVPSAGVKPLLAWLAVGLALITALGGLAYLIARYVRGLACRAQRPFWSHFPGRILRGDDADVLVARTGASAGRARSARGRFFRRRVAAARRRNQTAFVSKNRRRRSSAPFDCWPLPTPRCWGTPTKCRGEFPTSAGPGRAFRGAAAYNAVRFRSGKVSRPKGSEAAEGPCNDSSKVSTSFSTTCSARSASSSRRSPRASAPRRCSSRAPTRASTRTF